MPGDPTEEDIILELNSISDTMTFDSNEVGDTDAVDFHPNNVKLISTSLESVVNPLFENSSS